MYSFLLELHTFVRTAGFVWNCTIKRTLTKVRQNCCSFDIYHIAINEIMQLLVAVKNNKSPNFARSHVHTCKMPSTSEKPPMPTSISTVQLRMPNRNLVVTTVTLVTVTFSFHSPALFCFILNEEFNILQQQESLYLGYKILDRTCNSK